MSRNEPIPYRHKNLRWIKGDLTDNALHLHGYLADMIVQEERVYLYKGTAVAAFRIDLLSQKPTVGNLPAGQENQTGGFAIRDAAGNSRLLLHRLEGGGRNYLYMVNAANGELTQIGHLMLASPLVCVADSRLVATA